MPSFDIVSEVDLHEVANAVDQANREVGQRFDFKGTNAKFELKESVVTLSAPADFQLKQMLDILRLKLAKRGIDVECLKVDEPVVTGQTARQLVTLRQGIDTELGKKIQRLIKDAKLKDCAGPRGRLRSAAAVHELPGLSRDLAGPRESRVRSLALHYVKFPGCPAFRFLPTCE
jgi:uncharacterized protein YajQ (UPF0234 family)